MPSSKTIIRYIWYTLSLAARPLCEYAIPIRFTTGNEPPVPTKYAVEWAGELSKTIWSRRKSLSPPGIRNRIPQPVSLITIPTTLHYPGSLQLTGSLNNVTRFNFLERQIKTAWYACYHSTLCLLSKNIIIGYSTCNNGYETWSLILEDKRELSVFENRVLRKMCGPKIRFFLNVGAGWGWVLNATARSLYPREWPGTQRMKGWVDPRAGMNGRGKSHIHRDSIPRPSSP